MMSGNYRFLTKNILTLLLIPGGLLALWLAWRPLIHFIEWLGDRQAVIEFMQGYGAWGPALYIALLSLQIFVAMLPGHVLILAGGYVFGFFPALAMTVLSAVVCSQIAFHLARRAGRPLAYRLASRKVIDRWERISAHQGILFYFLVFVLPIFPSDAMCYVAGLGTISPRRFLVSNVLGRLTSSTFMTLAGAYGLDLPAVFWVAASLVVLGFYVVWLRYSYKHGLTGRTVEPSTDTTLSR
ncbi:MAG: VTT domain-containing protein [Chloroflexota bacterium]